MPLDQRVSHAVTQYRQLRPRYVKFADALRLILIEMLHSEDIGGYVEARTKEVESFERKIELKGYDDPLKQVSDLTALRVLTRNLAEVDRATAWLEREFAVDLLRSSDKAATFEPNAFGYISKHLIISVAPSKILVDAWSEFDGLVAEIQIRTFLQHAWATVFRRLGYKHETDVPAALQRRLYRLSASLESADVELDAVWREAIQAAKRSTTSVAGPSTAISFVEYANFINENTALDNLCDFLVSIGYECRRPGLLSGDLDLFESVGIRSLSELDQTFKLTTPWSRTFLAEDYRRDGQTRLRSPIDRNDVFIRLFVASQPEIFLRGRYRETAEYALQFRALNMSRPNSR